MCIILNETIKFFFGTCVCNFNDEGITCSINAVNKKKVFFPYSEIVNIHWKSFRMIIDGKNSSFTFPFNPYATFKAIKLIKFQQKVLKKIKENNIRSVDCKNDFLQNYICLHNFYKDCHKVDLSLNSKSTKADKIKATMLAEQKGYSNINENNVVEKFQAGKAASKYLEEYQKNEELYKIAKENEIFLKFHGREKEVNIATKNLSESKRLYDYLLSGKAISSLTQKEIDWALAGGIASGLAGGAAGVATALNIQEKNAEIRAQNKQITSNYAKFAFEATNKLKEQIDHWEEKLEKAKIKLVDDHEPEKLFEKIDISDSKVFVFYDGSFVVSAEALIHDVIIYNTVNAMVDGSLTAIVYQEDVQVGEATIVLPEKSNTWWANRRQVTLIGASTKSCADPYKPSRVEFKHRDLWAIEH